MICRHERAPESFSRIKILARMPEDVWTRASAARDARALIGA